MNPVKNQNNKAGLALAAAMVALTLYWAFTYSGPYRYLAELQLKWFGAYYSEATAIVIILGLLGIALGIKFLFRGAERPVPGTPSSARNAPTAMATATASEPWLRYFRYGALLVPFGFGGWTYYNGTHAGSLQQLTAVDFQNGKLQAHLVYADVRGHLSGTYLSKEHYLYIPMSAEQNAAAPVQLVVGVNEKEMRKYMHREADGTFIVRGVADKGLEGDVKYAFEKNGVTVGESVWVVHAGRDPSGDKTFGLVMMGVGIVVAGLVFGLDGFRKRKRTTTKPL
jgi:hypothetical protein